MVINRMMLDITFSFDHRDERGHRDRVALAPRWIELLGLSKVLSAGSEWGKAAQRSLSPFAASVPPDHVR
jgi:hypothetical protein